ncbi:MAG: hypothetical protein PVI86_17850 [Phycisphaerae bacterium]|jgi:hypothetical protein
MMNRRQVTRRRLLGLCSVRFAVACLVVVGFTRALNARSGADVQPQQIEKVRLTGVSLIEELPPLPRSARANLEGQVTGVPVPVFSMISDEQVARGEGWTAPADEPLQAVVYRNSHDTGFGNYNKATVGNFVGNLLHLGNGFPVEGGEISGYDLLVNNSVNNPGSDATVYVSLWDGDPLGVIDTRISDPPQPIAGTGCTFSELVKGGTGSNGCVIDADHDGNPDTCEGGFSDGWHCVQDTDCGLCPAVQGDDIPECPGLFRLECNFPESVTIPSRNVWMIVEHLAGCRTGWRWAFYDFPEVAAVGEENFCGGTCPNAPVPCVDLAVEHVDAASQWDEAGVGTCCEDPGMACDHTDGSSLNDCGHPSTCSDGVAETFDSWCFGAPSYFASFVASIYSPTTTAYSMVPVGGDGNDIYIDPGTQVELHIMLEGWDPDRDGSPRIRTWNVTIDPSGYTTGLSGALTPYVTPCTTDADCPYYGKGSRCHEGPNGNSWAEPCSGGVCSCTAGFMDCPQSGSACLDLAAWDTTDPYYCWGSTAIFSPLLVDPGHPIYGATLVLDVPPDVDGTFTVGFFPQSCTDMKDQNGQEIPLLGFKPAKIHTGCWGFRAPMAEPNAVTKNRYLSFVSGSSCVQTAHRVTFDSLPPPNDVLNGKTLWLGPPYQLSENSGSTTDTPAPSFTASYLQCEPYYTDWGQLGTIHVYHRGIVPEALYTIQAIEAGCPVEDEGCYTEGLTVATNRFGDIVGDCDSSGCTPPNAVVDFTDILALVEKFKNEPLSVSKPRGDIGDELPDRRVGFIDVAWAVHTFQGGAYPFVVPNAADCD